MNSMREQRRAEEKLTACPVRPEEAQGQLGKKFDRVSLLRTCSSLQIYLADCHGDRCERLFDSEAPCSSSSMLKGKLALFFHDVILLSIYICCCDLCHSYLRA